MGGLAAQTCSRRLRNPRSWPDTAPAGPDRPLWAKVSPTDEGKSIRGMRKRSRWNAAKTDATPSQRDSALLTLCPRPSRSSGLPCAWSTRSFSAGESNVYMITIKTITSINNNIIMIFQAGTACDRVAPFGVFPEPRCRKSRLCKHLGRAGEGRVDERGGLGILFACPFPFCLISRLCTCHFRKNDQPPCPLSQKSKHEIILSLHNAVGTVT